uniref:Uncharacterized protein n=1 Tax=Poecilia mexicana TaxID=48701 RepID=A0A3B3WEM9_9TELE
MTFLLCSLKNPVSWKNVPLLLWLLASVFLLFCLTFWDVLVWKIYRMYFELEK